MKFVIVTNNPKVRDELGQEFDVDYADITYREILCKVRDMIYEGHKLLTHPLSGSVKPNETPYKSILVAKKTGKMDVQDASIIENSIIGLICYCQFCCFIFIYISACMAV